MSKKRSTLKILYKIGVTFVYVAMIAVLIIQALTPGNESSNISNSVGDTIDKVVTQVQKPEAERINVSDLAIESLLVEGESLPIDDLTMSAGTAGKLQCTVIPLDASNKSLTYASSDEDVVTVYADGTLEANTAGVALVTVTSEDNANVHKSITVRVTGVLLEELHLSFSATEFYPDKTYGSDLEYVPANTTEREVSYTSSDMSVLTVDENGTITTLAVGEATVTAISKTNGEITDSVVITVTPEPVPEQIPVNSVTISSVSGATTIAEGVQLSKGMTGTIKSAVSPSNASNKALTYSSSDTSVATVNTSGKITAKAVGSAVITVTSQDDPTLYDTVTVVVVEVPVTKIAIKSKPTSIYVGESKSLSITYSPSNTSQKGVTWKSSNTSVLTVNSSGKITGKAAGTVTVTATSKINGELKDSFQITVEEKPAIPEIPVTAVTITNKTDLGYVGKNVTLSATVSPSDATNKNVLWESSDTAVATVSSDGNVTFLKAGAVTITAESSSYNFKDSVTITVKEVLSKNITLIQDGLTEGVDGYIMKVSTPATIVAQLDEDATVLDVTFSSSDPTVANIAQDGSIQALKRGTVTITVSTAYEGENTSVSFTLTVVGLTPDVESLAIHHEHEYGYVGSTCTLSATFAPLSSTDTLAWSSSNEKIATVTQGGTVTYLKAGTVTITAKCSSYDVEQSITLTVKEVLSENIELLLNDLTKTDDGYSLKIATSAKIGAMLDADATVLKVAFASSNPDVATIGQDGTIEAISAGTVTITVSTSYDDETTSESFELTVIGYSFKDTMENFYYWVRKSFGHFGAFLVLGIFAALTYHTLFPKSTKGKLLAFVVCLAAGFAVAGLTEIFQLPYFTTGRYCSFDDVMLDFQGYCTSTIPMFTVILLVHFITLPFKKRKARKEAAETAEFEGADEYFEDDLNEYEEDWDEYDQEIARRRAKLIARRKARRRAREENEDE